MKLRKFLQLQARYPFLERDLTWRRCVQNTREFIRTKVGFIAFRPFENLEFSAKQSSTSTPLKSEYAHARMECYTATEYQLSFHVEGEDEGTRLRYITTDVGDGSIQAHIDDVKRWFESCESFCGKQLVWERVVKRTVRGGSHTGLNQMNLEIYLFPPRYGFKSMPIKPLPFADPAAVAYARGEKMPPIVPGRL